MGVKQTHRKHKRVRKTGARLAQFHKRPAVADQVGNARNIRGKKATRCRRVRDQVAEVIGPNARLLQRGSQRSR